MNEHLQELKVGGRPKRKWEIELEEKEIEIEKLNKELQDTKEHLGEYLHEQEEENNRLNNIINELEEEYINYMDKQDFAKKCKISRPYLDKLLKGMNRKEIYEFCKQRNKIKELKGDSSNGR